MTIKELYDALINAYSPENLNKITGKLIRLYKNKNYSTIRVIANKISKYVTIDEEQDARCFSRLIMLYHPDKAYAFKKDMEDKYNRQDFDSLQWYSHIFVMADMDSYMVEVMDDSIDYDAEYTWESNHEDGYSFTNLDGQQEFDDPTDVHNFEKTFFNLIKIREYGRTDIELPGYYLEDFEEFEMAYQGLESLDGIEYCVHVKILDVSNNVLTELSQLWDLPYLEELYLANNQIGYIDALSNLTNLKIADLSGNQIDDVSALLELENLEYVNLMGNSVPLKQIQLLEKKGVMVVKE